MQNRLYLSIITAIIFAMGCNSPDKKAEPASVYPPAKQPVMEPFRFHKMIEVSPGEDYDILSWGRGPANAGAFEILHSDSAAKKYTTTTGDLDGVIVDAYNSDMDLDGNPEILIQVKSKDTVSYATMFAFEFSHNSGKAEKLDFPKLTKIQREGYRGNDNFYIKEGVLYREFPVYDGNGKNAKPTGQKRLYQYGIRDNSFTIKLLTKDTTGAKTAVKPVVEEPVKHKKSEKKHITEKKTKKKKHRRRHRSDDE